jgi:cytoskeletal protein RodZ
MASAFFCIASFCALDNSSSSEDSSESSSESSSSSSSSSSEPSESSSSSSDDSDGFAGVAFAGAGFPVGGAFVSAFLGAAAQPLVAMKEI